MRGWWGWQRWCPRFRRKTGSEQRVEALHDGAWWWGPAASETGTEAGGTGGSGKLFEGDRKKIDIAP